MKKTISVFIALILVVFVPTAALAATFKVSDSGNVAVSKGEFLKNLYTAGNAFTSDGDMKGDLMVAANTVAINGAVEQDVFAVANTLSINGPIGQTARVAGNLITVSNTIGSDLFVAGNSLSTTNASTISGDVFAAGNTLSLDGAVKGNVTLAGSNITINGPIAGDLNISNAQKVTLGSNARIDGKFSYSAKQEATISSDAVVKGATTYTPVKQIANKYNTHVLFSFPTAFGLVASFVLLLVLVLLLPKTSRKVVEQSLAKPWKNLGIGFVSSVVAPIAVIILLITIVGAKVAGVAAIFAFVAFILSMVFVPLVIAALLFRLFDKSMYRADWLTALVGVIVVLILKFIPVVGWIVLIGFFLGCFWAHDASRRPICSRSKTIITASMQKFEKASKETIEFFKRIAPGAKDGVEERVMFGYPCRFVNGNMFLGVFGNDIMMRLSEPDRIKFLAYKGAKPFEPTPGRIMKE